MGTRPGEASALKWKHISSDFRSVWIGESYSRGTTGSTKTKKARTVVMPDAIVTMLRARKELLKPQSDEELVFPTPTGLPIDDKSFNRRAWKTVLAELGIPYRKPYTTRKTAISHALANGANYIDVAAAAGHNPQTMHKYYADSIQRGSVFVSFE
jgi:integrase